MLRAEASCSGWLPAVTGKEIDVLNLPLYPFFFFFLWKWCKLQLKGGTYWQIPPYTRRSLPLEALDCEGAQVLLFHWNRVNRLSSQRMQGGCRGRGEVIPERKKVQRPEWLQCVWVLGSEIHSSQTFSSGRAQRGNSCCCSCVWGLEAEAVCTDCSQSCDRVTYLKEMLPPSSALILSSASLESRHRWSYSLVWGWVLGHVSSFF